jgi:uncharacterized membrane protein YedE/YeeE
VNRAVYTLLLGLALGLALSRIGFTSWDEVHRMFIFADLRLFLTFITAVVVLALAWRLVASLSRTPPNWAPRPIHRGTLVGGLLFGAGWAVAGACPGVVLVQLGQGQLTALWTLGGIFAGNWLYSVVHERYFRWSTGVCADD